MRVDLLKITVRTENALTVHYEKSDTEFKHFVFPVEQIKVEIDGNC